MRSLYHEQEATEWVETLPQYADAVRCLCARVREGGTIYSAGCGGSFAQALHFTGELIGGMETKSGREIRAITIGAEVAVLTATANDLAWGASFARQLRGATAHDALVVFSTSGQSPVVRHLVEEAVKRGIATVSITGDRLDNPIAQMTDFPVRLPGATTAHVQEHTLIVLHAMARALERA